MQAAVVLLPQRLEDLLRRIVELPALPHIACGGRRRHLEETLRGIELHRYRLAPPHAAESALAPIQVLACDAVHRLRADQMQERPATFPRLARLPKARQEDIEDVAREHLDPTPNADVACDDPWIGDVDRDALRKQCRIMLAPDVLHQLRMGVGLSLRDPPGMLPVLTLQIVEIDFALHDLVAGKRSRHHNASRSGLGEQLLKLCDDQHHRDVVHGKVDLELVLLLLDLLGSHVPNARVVPDAVEHICDLFDLAASSDEFLRLLAISQHDVQLHAPRCDMLLHRVGFARVPSKEDDPCRFERRLAEGFDSSKAQAIGAASDEQSLALYPSEIVRLR
mmetsp:Transcript_60757/g.195755  ORF Transcript_60757/g.195755 Transcript_60757/m.195755 type:complete len:336 (-) Transcript_60757:100-1107(-)